MDNFSNPFKNVAFLLEFINSFRILHPVIEPKFFIYLHNFTINIGTVVIIWPYLTVLVHA